MENVFKAIVGAGGGAIAYMFGSWDALLGVLLIFVITDYITGVLASAVEGKLSSSVGFKGIAKKMFIFIMVSIAHFIDIAIGNGNLIRDATIFFYLANELLSIIENSGRVGLPVPSVIQQAVEVLKGKGESK